jgi:hypothetical protein
MASKGRKEEPPSGKGRIKFRYTDPDRTMEFTIENIAGEGVKEALHAFGSAVAGRTLIEPKRLKNGGGGAATSEVVTPNEEETLDEEATTPEEAEEETIEETGEAPAKPKRKPKAPKIPATPDLTTTKLSLEDFMKQKGNPAEMMDKYAVVAVWYKEQFQITAINIHRIFAAFKVLGWESQLPTDIEKPLKNLTYTKKWFEKLEATGDYAIAWPGESEVVKMGAAKTS